MQGYKIYIYIYIYIYIKFWFIAAIILNNKVEDILKNTESLFLSSYSQKT